MFLKISSGDGYPNRNSLRFRPIPLKSLETCHALGNPQRNENAMLSPIRQLKRRLSIGEQQWFKFNLLRMLVRRDLAQRYKGSVLGSLWPLLNQLALLLIYTYVFSVVLQVKLSLRGLPQNNSFTFGLWLFAGLLPWMAFSGGLLRATDSVVAQPNFVKKVMFPLALLPLVPVLSSFIESMFGLAALIVMVAVLVRDFHPTLALLPLIWLPQLLFTAGLAYLLAALTVFIRDIPQTLSVILNLWLYLTPIVYPRDIVPEPFDEWVLWVNPMAVVVEVYRNLVLTGEVQYLSQWLLMTSISAVFFWIGLTVYRRLRPSFADVL
jgi:lipopolysaccharide transport system permease protein